LLYSLAEFGFAVLRARGQLAYEARMVISHRLMLLAGAGGVFASGAGLAGLAGTHLLAGGTIALIALRLAATRPVGGLDFKLLRGTASIGLAIFLSLLAFKVDVPLLQLLRGQPEEVGLYNAAYRLFEPLLLFPAAIMAGVFPALTRLAQQDDKPDFNRQARRLLLGLGGAGLLAAAALALFAQWLLPLLYGPGYAPAAYILRWLALAAPFLFFNSGLTHLLLVFNREKYNLALFAGALSLNIGANLLLIPGWGGQGAAFATAITELGLTIMGGIALAVSQRSSGGSNQSSGGSFQSSVISFQSSTLSSAQPETQIPQFQPLNLTRKVARWLKPETLNLELWGFRSLLLLIVSLPFEITQHPLLGLGSFQTITNLKLVYYISLGLAIATLWTQRKQIKWRSWLKWNSPELWLGLLLLVCLLSTAFGLDRKAGVKFSLTVAMGGLLWLALPFWLNQRRSEKLRLMLLALVGSTAFSAGLGLLEFVPELKLNRWLLSPFKLGATVAGPFLRLSGTFEYANIAAIYYELVLPFALVGLAQAISLLKNQSQPYPLEKRNSRLPFTVTPVGQVILWAVACGLLWEALLLSFSRSALPGMLAAVPVLAWVVRKGPPGRGPGLGLGFGLGLLLIGATIILSPAMVLRFKTQSDVGWFQATYSAPELGSLLVCQQLSVPVTVNNLTPLDWRGGRDGAYRLSYHWLDQNDRIVQFEGQRSELPKTLKAGDKAEVQARLYTPVKPGQYWLVWDVVQEDVSWFSLKSATYQRQAVEIQANEGSICITPPRRPGEASPPAVLPKVSPNPERGQLWKVAGQMIAARPVLGVGPDGYRYAYGQFSGQKEWDNRIFANSTPLELAADLGLVGTLVFVIFGAMVGWRLIGRGWQGRLGIFEAATLAALVAFGLHSLLDYFLGFHGIFILLWILLGVAAGVGQTVTEDREITW